MRSGGDPGGERCRGPLPPKWSAQARCGSSGLRRHGQGQAPGGFSSGLSVAASGGRPGSSPSPKPSRSPPSSPTWTCAASSPWDGTTGPSAGGSPRPSASSATRHGPTRTPRSTGGSASTATGSSSSTTEPGAGRSQTWMLSQQLDQRLDLTSMDRRHQRLGKRCALGEPQPLPALTTLGSAFPRHLRISRLA